MDCQNCAANIDDGWTLCAPCELRFAGMLLRLARGVTPLHDSLDATLHPGGHAPVRIQTATPPTPIRLDVLDLIDMLDSTARELWRCLDGIDALLAIVQMPPGIPVATVGINGAQNAAILAAQMLALSDEALARRLANYKEGLKKKIVKANEELASVQFKFKTN